MTDSVETTFYLQIEPDYTEYASNADGEAIVMSAKAALVTDDKPLKPIPNALVVKLTVRIPRTAFSAVTASAVIDVPEEPSPVIEIELP